MRTKLFTIIATMALTAALAAPAGVGAAIFGFGGNVEGGGKISFRVKSNDNGAVVQRLKFRNVTAACEGSSGKLNVSIFGSAPINGQLEFHVRGEGGGSHSRVTGEFNKRGTRAHGKVRLYGNFNDGQGGTIQCNTGLVDWKAHR